MVESAEPLDIATGNLKTEGAAPVAPCQDQLAPGMATQNSSVETAHISTQGSILEAAQDSDDPSQGAKTVPPPVESDPESVTVDGLSEDGVSIIQADPTHLDRSLIGAVPKEPDQHVVSQTRMFSVSGGDSLRMGAIATKADEVRGAVCRLLGFETDWKYGISIRLVGQPTDPAEPNPIRTRISVIGQEAIFRFVSFLEAA